MFILKGILRAESQEKVLLYLMVRKTGYGKAISEFFQIPLNPVQKQLARLEEDGVVVSEPIGKVRNFQLNPRYPFLDSLKELLKSALRAYPESIQNQLLVERTRPRQPGKPLVSIRPKEGIKE